jgi:hypothetical protein
MADVEFVTIMYADGPDQKSKVVLSKQPRQ